ncbi:hypothetical protein [Natribacillus halophilus]|uniref:Uncharacterized protein n=1 Tax=Natribacillus halophilus TaxID=549003 RepID=A0A1G8J5Z4_9BACI|nr:hypothetical protein [Natribacillus halophilus]SDI26669.1 hypothetical protein SAMN04488123_10147 [Natribacillus halophilus]
MYAQLCFKERSHTYAQVRRIEAAIKHTEAQLDQIAHTKDDHDCEQAKRAVQQAHLYSQQALYFEMGYKPEQ